MKSRLAEKFSEFLSSISGKKVAVAMHRKADIDAFAAAYAVSSVLKDATICTIDEPNSTAKKLADYLGAEYAKINDLDKSKFAGLIVVDTSSYELLKDARDWPVLCIIDHHRAEGRDMKAKCEVIDENSPSTSELIASMLPKDKINKKTAFALACGIVSDTARFKRAEKETFSILATLMEIAGAQYEQILEMAEPEFETDEKIAILTAFQRIRYYVSNGWVIATSEVGSNESNAAAAISEVADIVFVASWREKEKETRISARSRKHVSIELNKVMAGVCADLGGSGGGHPRAAGATIKAGPEDALKKCVDAVFLALK